MSIFTVVDVSAARSDELPLCDNVNECLLFRYDVCVIPFCRWWTRYVWRQLNKPVSLSANAGHFGGTSNIFISLIVVNFFFTYHINSSWFLTKLLKNVPKSHAIIKHCLKWMFRFVSLWPHLRVIFMYLLHALKDETCKHEWSLHFNYFVCVFFYSNSCVSSSSKGFFA